MRKLLCGFDNLRAQCLSERLHLLHSRFANIVRLSLTWAQDIVVIFALALLLPQLGCNPNNHAPTPPTTDGANREWTVMVYMSADDESQYSLEPYAIDDVNEMELVGSTDKLAIVIQLDRVPEKDSTNGDWTTAHRYLITYDLSYDPYSENTDRTIRSKLIADLGEVNMGSPKTLIDFVRWAKANYPANHYVLVLWNHGTGVDDRSPYRAIANSGKSQIGLFHPRGVIYDDTNRDFLAIPEVGYALNEVKPIDIVAFDACLMGVIEVAYEIRNAASLMCASQLSPPSEGYRYDLWLKELKLNPVMTPQRLAKVIVEKYVQSVGQANGVTESAIKLSELQNLANAVSEFSDALRGVAEKYEFELANARNETPRAPDREEFKDLHSYAGLVKEYVDDHRVISVADKVIQCFGNAILYNSSKGISGFNGLSIYLPSPEDANLIGIGYLNTSFAKETGWDEWLIEQRR